jgi:hypothetical protein
MKTQYRNKRAKKLLEFAMFDSMKKMAAQTPIPYPLLKEANDRGCQFASHHGRCDLMEFLEWLIKVKMPELATGEVGETIDWANKVKEESALTKKIQRLALEEKFIEFAGVDRFMRKLITETLFGELERMAFEFPSAFKGKGEVLIHQEVTKQIATVRATLTRLVDQWEQTKGKMK